MSFFDFASRMFPYWLLGIAMFFAVWNSKFKELLYFDKKSFGKFFLFMIFVSTVRFLLITAALKSGVHLNSLNIAKTLPLGGTLFVGWEDLCHALPLAILRKVLGPGKWAKPINFLATIIVMAGFGVGHIYQGVASAVLISLYIPWASSFGERKGFGTLVAGHMLYDFCTLGLVKLIAG